jgi:hypothetical protein
MVNVSFERRSIIGRYAAGQRFCRRDYGSSQRSGSKLFKHFTAGIFFSHINKPYNLRMMNEMVIPPVIFVFSLL